MVKPFAIGASSCEEVAIRQGIRQEIVAFQAKPPPRPESKTSATPVYKMEDVSAHVPEKFIAAYNSFSMTKEDVDPVSLPQLALAGSTSEFNGLKLDMDSSSGPGVWTSLRSIRSASSATSQSVNFPLVLEAVDEYNDAVGEVICIEPEAGSRTVPGCTKKQRVRGGAEIIGNPLAPNARAVAICYTADCCI